ncbi:hypothetical protein [Thioclava indica]|uniref:Uncharacterized protein n=1 Tax=Thioclava indica TaxID=1353528 RepID=A0A074JS21_9RHOB|nr:hypothetical protein [Thioclava indica]KEO59269.1 hypothetical protein DT23_04110 [Thioclava indica]
MSMMIAESYRGMGVIFEIISDRLLIPVAIIIALLGAGVIGMQLIDVLGIDPASLNRI